MKASDIKHRPVVSLNGGVQVGEVSDLTLDETNVQIGSVLLKGPDGDLVAPFPAVRHIGPDAVTIDDSRILHAQKKPSVNGERRISDLGGLPVLNEQGTVIGSVEDLEFDEETGQLTAVHIRRGGLVGIGGSHERIAASAVRGIGPDILTVDLAPAASA